MTHDAQEPTRGLSGDVYIGTAHYALTGVNVSRTTDALVEYAPPKTSTGTNAYGAEATVVGGKVTKIVDGVGNSPVPSNGYVLSGHGAARTWLKTYAVVGATVTLPGGTTPAPAPSPAPAPTPTDSGTTTTSTYNSKILLDKPVAFFPLGASGLKDLVSASLTMTAVNAPGEVSLPNGDKASSFNGSTQYLQVASNPVLSVARTGVLCLEAWMSPAVLQFTKWESTGYVHWMGKGTSNQHEYVARMYNLTNQENRPNRISGYCFNLAGALGSGSFFQDPIRVGEWIHYFLVINSSAKSSTYPMGYVKIFKNGTQRDQDSLADYNITPQAGTAPFRVGTRDMSSYFQGSVGKVAFYDRELTSSQISAHYHAMVG